MIEATIYTTCEIVLGRLSNDTFTRVVDKTTGFRELVVSPEAWQTSSAGIVLGSVLVGICLGFVVFHR